MADDHDTVTAITAWAEHYYPAANTPPPPEILVARFSQHILVALFEATTSRRHHLALIDQEPIRRAVEAHEPASPVRNAVSQSWQRHD